MKVPHELSALMTIKFFLTYFITSLIVFFYAAEGESIDRQGGLNYESFIQLSYDSSTPSEQISGHYLVFPALQNKLTQSREKEEAHLFLKAIETLKKLSFCKVSKNLRLYYLNEVRKIETLLNILLGSDDKSAIISTALLEYQKFYQRSKMSGALPPSEPALEAFRIHHMPTLQPLKDIVDYVQERCKKANIFYAAFHNLLTSNIPEKTHEIYQILRRDATSPKSHSSNLLLQQYLDPSYDNNRCEHNAVFILHLIKELTNKDFGQLRIIDRLMFMLIVIFTNEAEKDGMCYVELREIPNPLAAPLISSNKKTLRELLASHILDFSETVADTILEKVQNDEIVRSLTPTPLTREGFIKKHSVFTGIFRILNSLDPGLVKITALSIKKFSLVKNLQNEGHHLQGDKHTILVFECDTMGRLIFKGYLDALRKSHSQLPLLDMPCVNIEAFSIEDPSDQTSQNQGFIARLPVQNSYGDNFDGEEIKPLLYTLGHSYDGFGNARINPVSPVFCGKFNVNWLLSNNKIPIPSRILGIFHFYVEKLRGIRRVESFGPGMVISPTYAKSGSFSLYLVTPEFRLHIRPNITKNVLCFISPGFRFHVLGSITKNALCIVSPGFRLHVRPNITKNALCLVSEKFTLQLVCVPK